MPAVSDNGLSVAPTGTTCPAGDNGVSVVHVLLHRPTKREQWKEVDADPDPEKLWTRFCESRLKGHFRMSTRPPNLTEIATADG